MTRRSATSSLTAAGRGTSEGLADRGVRGEVCEAFAGRRKVRPGQHPLTAELIGHANASGGAVLPLPFAPVEGLRALGRGPISPNEFEDRGGRAHGGRA